MEEPLMLSKDEMDLFDNALRERMIEEQKKLGKSDDYIGRMAFGEIKSPRMKMQVIKGSSTKKPQQLRFADFINLCEALGMNWVDEGRSALKIVKKKVS